MIKHLARIGLALACAMAVSIGAARAQSDSTKAKSSALVNAVAAIQTGNTGRAEAILLPLVADPAFQQLPAEMQHAAYGMLGYSQLRDGRAKEAVATLKRACQSPLADGQDWSFRLSADFDASDLDDAVVSLTGLARVAPAMINSHRTQSITFIIEHAASAPAEQERALIYALDKASWASDDPLVSADMYYAALARLRLEDGKTDAALAAAHKLNTIRGLALVRADRRYATLIAADPKFFDPDRFFEQVWKNTVRAVADDPDRLEGINMKAGLLMERGDAAKALVLLEKALKRIAKDGDKWGFTDQGDQINWTLDLKSTALMDLGRYDEAIKAMKAGARTSEGGRGGNVSQTINLAVYLNSLGRPKEALQTVGFVEHLNVSAYGLMVLTETRACAYVQTGDTKALKSALAYLAAHRSDNVSAYLHGLICAGDDDGAAKLIISELASPTGRTSMLLAIQDYRDPYEETPIAHAKLVRFRAIVARPDVAAAVDKIGYVEHYDFDGPEF